MEVSGSAGLHRLHWEALRDPDLPVAAGGAAAGHPPGRRRWARSSTRPAGRPTLNILVVTARPDGPTDVGYRTISRPLLDALRTAGLPVTVDLVRPGTWEALRDHLRAATERHGSGWYQVIHFDLHGAFSEYAPLEAGARAGPAAVLARRAGAVRGAARVLVLRDRAGGEGRAGRGGGGGVAAGRAPGAGGGAERLPVRDAGRQRGGPGAAAGRGRGAGRGRDGVLGHRVGGRAGDAGAVRADRRRGRADRGGARRPPGAVRATRPGRRTSGSSWTWRTGCCRSCSPSSPLQHHAAADDRPGAGRVLRAGRGGRG